MAVRRSAIALRATLPSTVAFVSDVEGSTLYWDKYLKISRVLARCETTGRVMFKNDTDKFVFGGDAFDKGGDDLCFAQDLIQLKKDHPDRVNLLSGNRDVNKMRLKTWFDANFIASLGPPESVAIPYFMQSNKRAVSYAQYLARQAGRFPTDKTSMESYIAWRLEHTMGSAGIFELKRKWIAEQAKRDVNTVKDDDVLQYYLDSVSNGGVLCEYLPLTQIAAVVDGTMFVHGAVIADTAGYVPPDNLSDNPASPTDPPGLEWSNTLAAGGSVQDWVAALNEFSSKAVAKWMSDSGYNLKTGECAGSTLSAYAHTAATRGRTVMIRNFLDTKAGPKYVDGGVVEHLNHSGVFRVCAGHKPVGDTPMTIQQPGLSVHVADNSYCAPKDPSPDCRGSAVQEVILDGDEGTAAAHGRRSDGTAFDFSLDHPLVGRHIGDSWWTKAMLSSGEVLAHRTTNDYFTIEHKVVSPEDVEAAAGSHQQAGGDLFPRYTFDELKPPRKLKSHRKP